MPNLNSIRAGTENFANRIFVREASTNGFTIPDGIPDADGRYRLSVEPQITRTSGTNLSGSPEAGSSLSRSRTFFGF